MTIEDRVVELAKDAGLLRWDFDSLSFESAGGKESVLRFTELVIDDAIETAKRCRPDDTVQALCRLKNRLLPPNDPAKGRAESASSD